MKRMIGTNWNIRFNLLRSNHNSLNHEKTKRIKLPGKKNFQRLFVTSFIYQNLTLNVRERHSFHLQIFTFKEKIKTKLSKTRPKEWVTLLKRTIDANWSASIFYDQNFRFKEKCWGLNSSNNSNVFFFLWIFGKFIESRKTKCIKLASIAEKKRQRLLVTSFIYENLTLHLCEMLSFHLQVFYFKEKN